MKTINIIIVFCIVHISFGLSAQSFYNNGQSIHLITGAELFVYGSIVNNSGVIIIDSDGQTNAELSVSENFTNNGNLTLSGSIYLKGNWYNNGNISNNDGILFLSGENQSIGGNNSSTFSNLILSGTGIKNLENDLSILNTLDLVDSELAASNFGANIINHSVSAISFNNGFISTLQNGYLSLNMLSTQEYYFPLGSDFSNPILRPLKIKMPIAELSQFRCTFINKNPNEDGLYTSLIEDNIDYANSIYYHKIRRLEGISDVQVDFIFEESDGDFDQIAFWKNASPPNWQLTEGSTLISASQVQLNFSNNPEHINYVLCKKKTIDTIPQEIIIYNSFSPNGDNFNDLWIIESCENCSVKVFNRNGNLVFISDDNSNSWDGKYNNKDVPDATYYYIIETADRTKTFKGSLTILR